MFSRSRTLARNFITVVNQAEVVYREFLGSNRVRLEPGLRLKFPILHSIKRIDLRESMIQIPNLNAYTKDNVPVSVSGVIFYKAVNAEKACYAVSEYQRSVSAVGESSFRAVVGRFEFDEIIGNRQALNTELVKVIDSTLDKWGVSCVRFEVQHVGPQNKDVAHQLEKQMEAERRRRENDLNTTAQIRTAEGAKTKAILESEGELISQRNKADAIKYKMQMEATALAEQVEILAKATGSATAAQYMLLETKRLQHLEEIAKQPNRVYFLDPKDAFPSTIPMSDVLSEKK